MISRLESPPGGRAPWSCSPGWAGASTRRTRGGGTIRHRALFASRLPASIEPVPDRRPAGGGRKRAHPTELGKAGLAPAETLGVVAGGHEQRGRGVDADAIDGEQVGRGLFEERGDPGVEICDLAFEVA